VNKWDVHKVHCTFTGVYLCVRTYNFFFHLAEIPSVNTMSLNKSTVVTCAAYVRTQVEINILTALTWTNTNLTKSVVHAR
jgi:hypothetical protein